MNFPESPVSQSFRKRGFSTSGVAYNGLTVQPFDSRFNLSLDSMAFFPKSKLQPQRIEIDQSALSCQSAEIQSRLQRIDENYAQFDKHFADIQATIENDDRLREFNANLKAADLRPKKKSRWRSRSASKTKKKSSTTPTISKRAATLTKAQRAQLKLATGAPSTNTPTKTDGSLKQTRGNKSR